MNYRRTRMGRFENLEFGKPASTPTGAGTPTRDEHHFLSEAQAAFEQARFVEALRLYGRAIELKPSSLEAWVGQVRALVESAAFLEAGQWADKALEKFPNDPVALSAKAVACARLGDGDAALAFSDSAISEGGSGPDVWLGRGEALLVKGDTRSSGSFDRLIATSEGSWVWLWLASRAHLHHGQAVRALDFAQKALALDGARGVLWLELARCQAENGLPGPARESLARAAQADPRLEGITELGNLLSDTGFLTSTVRKLKTMLSG